MWVSNPKLEGSIPDMTLARDGPHTGYWQWAFVKTIP